MELPTKITCEVKLRLSDVLDPFAYTSINLFNWFLTAIVCIVLYRPYWVFGPYSEEPWQDHVGFDMFICLAWSMFVGLPYLSLLIRFWKSPTLEKPRQFTFDAEGMHVESEDARGDYKWSLFRSVFEMKKSFVFRSTGWSGTYLPKRCLTGSEEILQMRQLIRDNFKGKKTLRNN